MISLASAAPTRFRRRILEMDPSSLNTGWEDILVPVGLARAGLAFEDAEMMDWAACWFAHHHAAGYEGTPPDYIASRQDKHGHFIGDFCGNWGGPLVFGPLHRARPSPDHAEATRRVCDGLLQHAIRFPDGTFAHGGWDYARKTIWVDTLYYSASVLAEAFALTGEKRYAEEAIRQARLHSEWLRDPTTGGWFHDAEPESGKRTNAFWARGNGWIILALADTLRLCPSDLPGWDDVLADYRLLATFLLRLQHGAGLWRIVPENPDSHLETSGSAMILAGLAMGVSAGWLETSIRIPILRGAAELLTWIDAEGVLQGAQGPAGSGSWDVCKLSPLGERTFANGLLLRLLADLREAELISTEIFQSP